MATNKDARSRAADRLKMLVRRALDRVAQPYVDQAVDRVARLGAGHALPAHFSALAETLHEARTLALADVPRGAQTMLSAGASGAWYFEWIDSAYGSVGRHIAVEAFSPEPADLPANVEWVAADIAGPDGLPVIEEHSVDLLFCGQNVEHLWPRQMVKFFVEANRVIADGGLLVIDSPNRAIAAEYGWSMAEHTVEMTPAEAEAVLEAAGFTVEAMKGVWLCRAGADLLPLEADPTAKGAGGVVRRFALATARPDDSFIWWAEARRTGEPDRERLTSLVDDLFSAHWPERVSRLRLVDGVSRIGPDGRVWARSSPGWAGTLLEGPSMPLPAGEYRAMMSVQWGPPGAPGSPVARLEIGAGDRLIGAVDVCPTGTSSGAGVLECPFVLDELSFGVSARLVATGNAALTAARSLTLDPEPWRSLR